MMQQSEGRYGALLAARMSRTRKDMDMMTKARRKAQPIEDELLLDLDQEPIVFRESMHRQKLLDSQTGSEVWSLTTDNWMYD